MLLYLVRHGEAKSKEESSDRPLTEEGRREVEAVMLLMMRFGAITATRVLHSGKLRAGETAEIIASKLDVPSMETDGLDPNDDPAAWQRRLAESDEDVLLVGHLPHLSRLASRLLCGDQDLPLVDFAAGVIVCLNRDDQGHWTVHWSIPPSLVQ